MKRTTKIMAALACACALCLAFVGCSSPDYTKNFSGDWKLVGIDSDGATDNDIALLEAFGVSVGLTLNEDGTASLSMFGESMDGTWKAKSATEAELTLDSDTITATLADEKLKMEADGNSMTFERGKAEAADIDWSALDGDEGDGENDSATKAAKPDPVEINATALDNELVTLVVEDKRADEFWDDIVEYSYLATNKTDKSISISSRGRYNVNGSEVQPDFFFIALDPGESRHGFIKFKTEDVATLDDLANVTGKAMVADEGTHEELGLFDIAIP